MRAKWHGMDVADTGDVDAIREQRAFLARRARSFAEYARLAGVSVPLVMGARTSVSAYVYVDICGITVRVRFSDHDKQMGSLDVGWRPRVTNRRLLQEATEAARKSPAWGQTEAQRQA